MIERTIAAARKRWQGTDADIFDFLRDALTLDLIRDGRPYIKPRVRQFALKMQQFTGPMAAKSLEDTALYRYHASARHSTRSAAIPRCRHCALPSFTIAWRARGEPLRKG